MQALGVVQETPLRKLWLAPAGLGAGWIPFGSGARRSARPACPARDPKHPAA